MRLTDEQIKECQTLFEEEFGKKVSREEAIEWATNLIHYLEIALPIALRIAAKQNSDKIE